MANWKSGGVRDLPLAADNTEWDGDKAKDQIFRWAGWPDDPDPAKARKCFMAYDADAPNEKESYKLPFAYIREGKPKAVPAALHAIAVVLEGGRGGVELPRDVKEKVRKDVEAYYKKMGEDAPW
jgi:hypothetical protein